MMPKINRLTGRFFTVLISLSLAIWLPRVVVAGTKAPAPTLCQISDTVYRADGSPAHGTVLVSWQAFTTAAGQAVSPGSLLVTLDAQGGFNASLAPNTGASPAGSYYRAIFKLDDGTTETEIWVVPNTQTTTIGAIRSKLVPAQQAAQFLTRDVADSVYVSLASTQTITGTKTFSASPAVPTPQNPTDAANKSYVDANAGGGNLASPPPIGNVTPNSVAATTLTAQTLNGVVNAAAYPGADWSVAANGAIAAAPPGATVDLRGFSAAQLAVPGSATIMENKALHVIWPGMPMTLKGCPGINVTSLAPVVNEGSVWEYSYTPGTGTGTALISGAACPLIQDLSSSGSQWRNLELNGNSVGTIGFLFTANGGSGYLIRDVHVHHFRYTGAIAPGAGYWSGRLMFNNNGGDGLLIGSAPVGEGDFELDLNAGNGIHAIGESIILNGPDVNRSGLHGIYHDGRIPPDWSATTTFVSPSLIKPNSSINAGNYYFYSVNVNCTTAGSSPAFPQTVGAVVTDGSCIWLNMSTLNSGLAPHVGMAQGIADSNVAILNSGNAAPAGFQAANIMLEGASPGNPTCGLNNTVTGGWIDMQSGGGTQTADGIHIKNCAAVAVSNLKYQGASYSNGVSPADGYGLIIENSYNVSVQNWNPTYATKSAVKILSSSDVQINGFLPLCWSNNAVTGNDAYALQIDAASHDIQVNDVIGNFLCGRPNALGILNAGSQVYIDSIEYDPSNVSGSKDSLGNAVLSNAHGRSSNIPVEFDIAGNAALSIDVNAKVTAAGALSFQSIPGVEFLVSKYASIQAAINAAYNNGAVLGTVIDDRTAPYTGPGFILYDSVTLQLAATTYTITSTVTYNNGNNNVTAGIIAIPGARLVGASTSTNHGTILTAGNGLNADLIATSTVGTGIGSTAQWWHWGGFENLRVMGNGANQTAGNCFNIENMGETSFLRGIEVSGCKLDNILFTGASATPSDIANITTNSAGRYGFNFNNLAGMAVVHGLSGDSNTTSLVRLNGGQSGTLTILGFKTEEEISGQDPLITIDESGQNGAQPSLFIIGGYTFGRNGVNDIIKYVNGTAGTTPYISVSNFYTQNYVNAVNDTVNNRTTTAINMNKVPFYYGPTGAFYSGQAFTLDLNTFVQSPHSGNGVLTEVFGTTSSNETLVGASGTSTDISIGGIGFRMPNRAMYGQTPELFAKMTYAFPGGVPNTQQWEFIPAKVSGDNSTRWIGDPGYRWDEIYSADVNSTTATVGTLNVTTCNGCGAAQVNSDWNASSGVAQILNKPALATVATSGSYNDLSNKPAIPGTGACGINQFQVSDNVGSAPSCAQVQYSQLGGSPTTSHLVSGTMQGNTATLTGNSADQTVYSASLPAGTFSVGTGAHCWAKWQHTVSGSTSITYKWMLGSTTVAYAAFTSASQSVSSDIEVLTPASLNSQIINASAIIAGNGFQAGQSYGNAGSENLANADTLKLTFNAGSGEQVKGVSFYCQTVQ